MYVIKPVRVVKAAGVSLLLVLVAAPALADFKTEWKELIAAARQEGKVVLNAVPGARMRKELPAAFKKKFGVNLEFVAVRTGSRLRHGRRRCRRGRPGRLRKR